MNARFETIDDRPVLHFERHLSHPVQAVWSAVTDPAELVHWFPCAVEAELRRGGRMRFTFPELTLPDGSSSFEGEVIEFDPPRRFWFTWGEDELRFELEPTAEGNSCLLRLTVVLGSRDKAARDAAGWDVCLDALRKRLAGGPAGGAHTGLTPTWRGRYEEYVRQGLPTGAPIPE
jgi:uncharacterized protein YndB with AHSA1/START domain